MENQNEDKQVNNVSELETPFTKEQRQKFNKMQKKIVYRRRRLTVMFLVAAVMIAFLGMTILQNVQQLSRLEKELDVSVQELDDLTAQQENMSQEVSLLKDEEYLAKLAREKFYYSREGETVYNFPQGTTGSTESSSNK